MVLSQTKCNKCTETLTASNRHTHNCNYKRCSFCRSYYPPEIIDFHYEACHMNPQSSYSSPQQSSRGRSQIPVSSSKLRVTVDQGSSGSRGQNGSGNNTVMVQTTVLPNGLVIQRSYSRNPNAPRNGNQRSNAADGFLGGLGSLFNDSFMNDFFGEDDFMTRGSMRNNIQANGQTAGNRDARQANRQRQGMNALRPANPLSGLMEMFGIMDHPFLSGGRSNQANARMMGGPNGGMIIISSDDQDTDFQQHRAFMRNHQSEVRNQDFIGALLNALLGGSLIQSRPATRAMDRTELSHLKVTKYVKPARRKEGEEEQCPICCMELEHGVDVKILPCKHTFHPGCIDTWLVRNCTCPICKRDVKDLIQGGDGQVDRD